MKKIILVYGVGFEVLTDYIQSLNIVDKEIELKDFLLDRFLRSKNIYIFTQMWMKTEVFQECLYTSDRFIYLNVEMLTEQNRWNNIENLIKKNVRIADYSLSNIQFIKTGIKVLNLKYGQELIYLPYQYNLKECFLLENKDHKYKYDVGVINAFPRKDSSVNPDLKYKRSELFERLEENNFNCVNILGWGNERDEIIKQCKIILNIHHFEVYNIFEHIRCDRLLFSNKLIISEKSLYMEDLDIFPLVHWKEYNDILAYTKHMLENFDIYQTQLEKRNKKEFFQKRTEGLKQSYEIIQKPVILGKGIYICGCVKNCAKFLPDVFQNILLISELFKAYKIVIAFDVSDDNSLDILQDFKKKIPSLCLIINESPLTDFRTQNIANARNSIIDFIRKDDNPEYEHFIMMDFDDCCSLPINIENFKTVFKQEHWDAVSFNLPAYYDIWALSYDPYIFSCWFFMNPDHAISIVRNDIQEKLKQMNQDELFSCYSAFNGFSIYRKEKFMNCYYEWVLTDQSIEFMTIPKIQEHATLVSSMIRTHTEECEHRSFHFQAISKNSAKIRISPLYVFDYISETHC